MLRDCAESESESLEVDIMMMLPCDSSTRTSALGCACIAKRLKLPSMIFQGVWASGRGSSSQECGEPSSRVYRTDGDEESRVKTAVSYPPSGDCGYRYYGKPSGCERFCMYYYVLPCLITVPGLMRCWRALPIRLPSLWKAGPPCSCDHRIFTMLGSADQLDLVHPVHTM